MKILALDFGLRRIGVAIYENNIITSRDTIVFHERQEAINIIFELCRKEDITKIVLGLPKGHEDSEDKIRSFALDLSKTTSLPVDLTDETLSSKEAERILKESKLNPKTESYKQKIDQISAKLILEQYLRESNS